MLEQFDFWFWAYARAVRVVTTRARRLRGVLRLADCLVGRMGRARGDDRPVPFGRYHAWISFTNPPEAALFFHGVYEEETTALLHAYLRPGDVAVDVGANCGVLTLEMAALVGREGCVISIDPSPLSAERIRAQAGLNGMSCVQVHQVALDDHEAASVPYYHAACGIGALPGVDLRYTTGHRVDVPMTTLDRVLASTRRPVSLLKIDTDGHELAILKGAQETLATDRPLLFFEITPSAMVRRSAQPEALLAMLEALGYTFLVPKHGRFVRFRHYARASAAALLASSYEGNVAGFLPADNRHTALAEALLRGATNS